MMLVQSVSCFSYVSLGRAMRKHIYSRNRPHLMSGSGSSGGWGEISHLFCRSNSSATSSSSSSSTSSNNRTSVYPSTSCFSKLCSSTNVEIVEIIQNKVLIAAVVSAAIGQLSKPFTSTIFYGNNFDFKNAFQAGGFPSVHSSAAVATATILGLERGFSDTIFGLAVVYAGLIMYDAQGVRREVGSHAKALNRVLCRNKLDSDSSSTDANDFTESFSGESSSNVEPRDPRLLGALPYFKPRLPLLFKSDDKTQSTPLVTSSLLGSGVKGESESIYFGCPQLKESVGHTEFEVIAGALLGFFVSLAVCII